MTVFLRGLNVYAFHGATSEERSVGHRYLVNLEVGLPDKVGDTDLLSDTVNYADLGAFAAAYLREQQFATVERAVNALAHAVLAEFKLASQVTIELSKLLPPADLIADSAGVRLTVART